MDSHVQTRWQEVCDRWSGGSGYAELSGDEKVWLNIRSLIASIENGGLISYYYNSGADTLSDCLQALHRLDADDVARQVNRVSALFGSRVPCTLDERNRDINSWSDADSRYDELLDAVDDLLMPMMVGLEAKLGTFLHDAGLAT